MSHHQPIPYVTSFSKTLGGILYLLYIFAGVAGAIGFVVVLGSYVFTGGPSPFTLGSTFQVMLAGIFAALTMVFAPPRERVILSLLVVAAIFVIGYFLSCATCA